MDAIPYLALLSALAGLILAVYFYGNVKAAPPGTERMVHLMVEIQKGARAFLRQEYAWVAVFVAIMAVVIGILIAPAAALTYVIGAVLSASAGYAGMTVATMANARTTNAAQEGPGKALPIAFRGGAVMGFSVAGLALGGLALALLTSSTDELGIHMDLQTEMKPESAFFSETQSRAIIGVSPDLLDPLEVLMHQNQAVSYTHLTLPTILHV